MKKVSFTVFFTAAFSLFVSVCFAQTVQAADPTNYDIRKLFTPEIWLLILGVFSNLLTVPLTTTLKLLFKTEGITTFYVNSILNSFLIGLLPWLTGFYPFLYAIVASALAVLVDKMSHTAIKDISKTSAEEAVLEDKVFTLENTVAASEIIPGDLTK